ncbi:hypothetical protein [Cronobacter sakazakii]|uniref:hypothetical protein n=1 Tax=Cronobacter sakazakii TaxID=28141 RepID=UPI0034E8FA83
MSAGTLTLTNKSAAVTGNGTLFTTELKAGGLIVVKVGGTPYTLPVKAITNNTQLTLVSDYTGPTQSGVTWFAVPQEAQSLITAALASQTAEALRGLNLDKTNWQQVFSASDDITVTLKDGSTFSGPSWLKLVNLLNGTIFEVVNSYATQPGSGVLMRGGEVKSTIKTAGQVKSSASLVALQRVGASAFSAITVNDGATTRVYSIPASDVDVDLLATNSPQGAVAWCRFSADTIVAAFNISSITKEAAGAYRLFYQNPPADDLNQSIQVTAIQSSSDVNAVSGSVYSIGKTSFAVATRNNTGRLDASVMVTVHRK